MRRRRRTRSPICSIRRSTRAPPAWVRAPGLQPPPDNSFDRRADFSASHRARKSTTKGFEEAPQRDYAGSPVTGLDPELARELGLGDDDDTLNPSPERGGSSAEARQSEGGRGGVISPNSENSPPPADLRSATSPLQGEVKKSDPKYRLPKADLPQPGHGLSSMGVAATAQALENLLREGRPEFAAAALDAAPPAAAGKIRRRQTLRHQIRFRAEGRPAAGDQGPGRRRQAQRPHAGAAWRHRLRQDLHHGQGDRGDAAPGAHPRAEQDAGGAALRRVQVVLPRQRGGIFRLLLRLLPAGSLRPAHRHLHREGILDQRADRPHAPLGDARAARARRRHHRRFGVLHLRHRLGRNLFGHDLHAQAGRQDRSAPVDGRSGGAAIQAHAGRFLPRLVPRARRHHRHFPGAL